MTWLFLGFLCMSLVRERKQEVTIIVRRGGVSDLSTARTDVTRELFCCGRAINPGKKNKGIDRKIHFDVIKVVANEL